MGIVKCTDYIDAYKHKALLGNVGELSGRTGRPDLTEYVSREIVKRIQTDKNDTLIDIGCGDGTVLKKAYTRVKDCIGILPNREEVEKVGSALSENYPKIIIQRGLAQETSLPSNCGTKIVCNGVFILLSDKQVEEAFMETGRIAQPGGVIFIGEVPVCDEFADKTYGDSIVKWLIWVLKNQGVGIFCKRFKRVVLAIFSREMFVIMPKYHFYSNPDDFIQRAEVHGLVYLNHFIHEEIDLEKKIVKSKSRYDYLFRSK